MAREIVAIDLKSVQKICSGQVIVDLATAVKELVENSLDAGARNISILLKEMGSERIEVADDGSGLSPSDYETVALKHYTSKLKIFEDLLGVNSFGFRGEALNSICELSGKLIITTKREVEGIGTQLEFEKSGRLLRTMPIARTRGTSVIIDQLFVSLPVRRGEFMRTIKKQYQRLLRVLQSYAVISTGVKITVFNVTKGTKQLVLCTEAGADLAQNISSIFGSAFHSTLLPVNISFDLQNQSASPIPEVADGTDSEPYLIECEEAEENSEYQDKHPLPPLDQIAVTKLQHSDVALECEALGGDVMREELRAEERSKKQLLVVISGFVSKVGDGVGRSDNDRQFVFVNKRPVDVPRVVKVFNEVWRKYEMKNKPAFIINIVLPPGTVDVNLTPDKREVAVIHEATLLSNLREFVDSLYAPSRFTFRVNEPDLTQRSLKSFQTIIARNVVDTTAHSQRIDENLSTDNSKNIEGDGGEDEPGSNFEELLSLTANAKGAIEERWNSLLDTRDSEATQSSRRTAEGELDLPRGQSSSQRSSSDATGEDATVLFESPNGNSSRNSCRTEEVTDMIWSFDPAEVTKKYFERVGKRRRFLDRDEGISGGHSDATTLIDEVTRGHQSSVTDLWRILSKQDFPLMRVIGQFNLGFIIVELRGDMYILDQHACDEKFRFEAYQQNTKIKEQPLLAPLHVYASPAEEDTIMANLEVFRANGFEMQIDEEAVPGERIQLLSIPFSKSTEFGRNDVLELASMMSETSADVGFNEKLAIKNGTSGKAMILPKVLSMFASRACRSAVMIGTALSVTEMRSIVSNLQTIDQPWNCPHGRPTMRHLADLAGIYLKRNRREKKMPKFVRDEEILSGERHDAYS